MIVKKFELKKGVHSWPKMCIDRPFGMVEFRYSHKNFSSRKNFS